MTAGRKKIIYAVLLLIVVFSFYLFFVKSPDRAGTSKYNLAGTYAGEMEPDENETVSVEFDIDEQHRITRIMWTRAIVNVGQKTVLWKYPDMADISFTITDQNDPRDDKTYSFKRSAKTHAVKINDPKGGFFMDSTFDIHDSDNFQGNSEIRKLSTNQNVFYIEFGHTFFKANEFQINHKDAQIPQQINYENFKSYCRTAYEDIVKILWKARGQLLYAYNLSPGFSQCSFPGYQPFGFHPKLKFTILPGEIHSYLQQIVNRQMQYDDLTFEVADVAPTLEIPEFKLYARISINTDGYGQFGYQGSNQPIPVSKIDYDLSDEAIQNSTAEWKAVFLKSHKNKNSNAMQKRLQKAARHAAEKMKYSGPE